jgi:flagellar basal-body rod modification protein FlgD
MDLSSLSAVSSIGQATAARDTIAGNFDAFLTLLTTQLKNQNPLDPLDTNEFTAQLVQFSGVEQSIETNKNLEQLVALSLTGAFSNTVNYIGKTVVADGNVTQFTDGQATWNYSLPADAPEATITVRDAGGNAVFSQTKPLAGGNQTYVWDALRDDGTQAADGFYSIEIDAKDASGNTLSVSTEIEGVVSQVDLTGIEPVLTVNGSQIGLSAVRSVKAS